MIAEAEASGEVYLHGFGEGLARLVNGYARHFQDVGHILILRQSHGDILRPMPRLQLSHYRRFDRDANRLRKETLSTGDIPGVRVECTCGMEDRGHHQSWHSVWREIYFARCLGFSFLTIAVLTVMLTGSIPLTADIKVRETGRVSSSSMVTIMLGPVIRGKL
jgi:hypothetical protein